MTSPGDWFVLRDIGEVDSPALIVYKDRVEHNIREMIRIVGDPGRLMPHIKTYKIAEVIRMQMESGIKRFKCATISEAELLGLTGAEEALLAHQPSEIKMNRLASLIKTYPGTRFSTLVDNRASADMMNSIVKSTGRSLDVYIDINNGNDRTGIIPEKTADLYGYCRELDAINLLGLHIYDGHIRNPDPEERQKACDTDFEKVEMLINTLREQYRVDMEIIAGGSPTFPIHAKRKQVICSPGTTLFWDAGYASRFEDMPFLPAAVLVTRIISHPAEDLYCLDLGHKAIASENPLEKRIFFLNKKGLQPVGHSEEHLVVRNAQKLELKVGDILYGLPYHVCPTTALYDRVLIAEDGKITGTWEVTARTRKINY